MCGVELLSTSTVHKTRPAPHLRLQREHQLSDEGVNTSDVCPEQRSYHFMPSSGLEGLLMTTYSQDLSFTLCAKADIIFLA